ncbi:MAG: polysaccharide deacetylase family protein, partial [Puniceicoccales bacterium]
MSIGEWKWMFGIFLTAAFLRGEPLPDIRICPFAEGKAAAISLTFDDGILDQFTVARPLLNERDLPATFFIVVQATNEALDRRSDPSMAQKMSWDQLAQLMEDGHEIGNHSDTHRVKLKGQEPRTLTREIVESASVIEGNLGVRPVSFAFPWNAYDEESMDVVLREHINARTKQYGVGRNFRISQAENWLEKTIRKQEWGVVMLHAIIPDFRGYDPLPNGAEDLEEFLDLLERHRDNLWIATFGEVSKYKALAENSEVEWIIPGETFM